ncbi:hypothetical protein [Enhygromyxa salina]|uniref:hypothetical protein n=1 Tax=Enhygromyxa salina TaxID=215803 RepID=UPI0011B1E891|nr:hypothetical protein [Enhygromyxa salina]
MITSGCVSAKKYEALEADLGKAQGELSAARGEIITLLGAHGCAPRLPLSAFLPEWPDPAIRDAFYTAFQRAEVAIDALRPGDRIRPTLVRGSGVALWHVSGVIEIPVQSDDIGVVYHEAFHGAFHGSALHRGDNERWGEGLCDTFRYFMEERYHSTTPSPWLVQARKALAEPDVLRSDSETVIRRYVLPMVLIVKHVDTDYATFAASWRRWQDEPPDLSKLFGYTPP